MTDRRPHDVVAHGATGYVGALVAAYLAEPRRSTSGSHWPAGRPVVREAEASTR